jgi:hypothetical protein
VKDDNVDVLVLTLREEHMLRVFDSQSQSQSYFTTDGQSVSMSWCRAQFGTFDQRFFFVESYSLVLFGAPSLTRGRVCHLSVFCQ